MGLWEELELLVNALRKAHPEERFWTCQALLDECLEDNADECWQVYEELCGEDEGDYEGYEDGGDGDD